MQVEQSKSCGNCVFLQYTPAQIRNAEIWKKDVNKSVWGYCPKNGNNFYKNQTCEKHEPKESISESTNLV